MQLVWPHIAYTLFLLMVAMQDHYYFILTRASSLQHKDKVPAEGAAYQFCQVKANNNDAIRATNVIIYRKIWHVAYIKARKDQFN